MTPGYQIPRTLWAVPGWRDVPGKPTKSDTPRLVRESPERYALTDRERAR